jgi:hypothetical protein
MVLSWLLAAAVGRAPDLRSVARTSSLSSSPCFRSAAIGIGANASASCHLGLLLNALVIVNTVAVAFIVTSITSRRFSEVWNVVAMGSNKCI